MKRVYHNNNKFPIKWNIKEFVKILGIHSNNDIGKMKRYNITKCIQKWKITLKYKIKDTFLEKGKL